MMQNNENQQTAEDVRKKRQKRAKKKKEIKVNTPADLPTKKGKKKKVLKGRIHIYISDETLDRIDEKADELGLDRSPCIQMLLNVALNAPVVRKSSQR